LAAFDTTLLVTVADGVLNLSFIAENDVLISAIAVTAGAGPASNAESGNAAAVASTAGLQCMSHPPHEPLP
jgi:hypothetical protein